MASQGPVPGNLAASWTIVSGPTGHAATLDGADTLFPTLTADLPGTYDVELDLSFPSTTGGATDLVSIQVYDLAAGPQGSFSTADPVAYAATLTGPAGASLSVDGGTATTSGSLAGSKPARHPGAPAIRARPRRLELCHALTVDDYLYLRYRRPRRAAR